jgi:hypothetical protein
LTQSFSVACVHCYMIQKCRYTSLHIQSKKKKIDFPFRHALQRHCTAENSKQIFPEMELRGLVPNFHIDVSVSDLNIPTISPPIMLQKIGGPIVGIYKSVTDT